MNHIVMGPKRGRPYRGYSTLVCLSVCLSARLSVCMSNAFTVSLGQSVCLVVRRGIGGLEDGGSWEILGDLLGQIGYTLVYLGVL